MYYKIFPSKKPYDVEKTFEDFTKEIQQIEKCDIHNELYRLNSKDKFIKFGIYKLSAYPSGKILGKYQLSSSKGFFDKKDLLSSEG